MKCPQIKINRQTDILCAHKVNNIYMHIKKTLYIIVLTICFVLALIGKSYGQDLKIVDEDSFSVVLNSIKKGDFFYNIEAQSVNRGEIKTGLFMLSNHDLKDVIFTKRNMLGQMIKKVSIGRFFHSEVTSVAYYVAKHYYFYNIISKPNNEFAIAFINDSIVQYSVLNGVPIVTTKQYFEICNIKEQTNFSSNTVYNDSLTSHYGNNQYVYNDRYNVRNVNVTSNNNIIFTKSEYNNLDSTYTVKLLMVDNNGILLHTDSLFRSKINSQTLTFINNDTIFVLKKNFSYNTNQQDTLTLRKYNNDLQLIQELRPLSGYAETYSNVVYLENNDIYSLARRSTSDSFYIHSILGNQNTNKYPYLQLPRYYSYEPYYDLEKIVTKNNEIVIYQPSISSDGTPNDIILFNTSPLVKKYTHTVIQNRIKFAYRGILRDATANIMSYASEKNDSCIYVFGNISFLDSLGGNCGPFSFSCIAYNKTLLFVKKVCNSQSDYNLDNFVIEGNVFADFNDNCIEDSQDKKIKNLTITDDYKGMLNFTSPDTNGNYIFSYSAYDTGIHTIKIRGNINYSYYIHDSCSQEIILVPYDADTISNINLSLKPSFLCPINNVNVSSSPPFRIGQAQTYYVDYCNNGTVLSPNTYVTIKLDSLLDINGSSITYSTLPNHTYRFNIGNLDYLTCGSFNFVATPRIGSVQLNQTLCVEAHIYPDTVCTTPNYTGSYIVASAQCLGDSVELKLENRGGDMLVRKRYKVIEDQVMRINNEYQLPRNGTLIEKMPADSGHTYRIIAEQEDDLPASYGDKFATAAIEGCRPNPNDNFSTGFFAPFPDYDGEPFRDLSCNVITGAYDPNDKVASPLGYAAQHYIEKNTQIDYQINFQNTGNDTAFKVVLVDTISPNLDINSIQLGVASHAYQFQRTDSNVVQFVFDNILLVDSFRNEPKSHGFVKFKIQQKLNNPNGTKIYNKADIYFDYNAPIVTNLTYHTVGQNFITAQLISSVKNPKFNVKVVKVFPNPFREKTQIIVEAELLKNPVLLLMNVEGKIIKTILFSNNNTFDIYREDLTNGMYLFKIMQGNDEVANGKVMVQ